MRGRQHDRYRGFLAAGQPRAGRQHLDLGLAGRDARCCGLGARLREARRAQSASGRSIRLRARLPRAVRGFSDQLRVLVRKLDRQHRNRGGGRGLSLGARSRNQQPADERHRHGRRDLAIHVREYSRAARGRGAADLDGGARADPDPRRRVSRLVLVRFRELHLGVERERRLEPERRLSRRLDGAVGLHGHRERGRVGGRDREPHTQRAARDDHRPRPRGDRVHAELDRTHGDAAERRAARVERAVRRRGQARVRLVRSDVWSPLAPS